MPGTGRIFRIRPRDWNSSVSPVSLFMNGSKKWILGLTGGIGTGKSTVSNFFRSYGCTVINADTVARMVVAPGTRGISEIVAAFGKSVTENGEGCTLDRRSLRHLVFSDAESLDRLNKIMYPLIMSEIKKQISEADGVYTVVEAPLLFEYGLDSLVNRILCMISDTETQIQRTMERDGCSRKIAESIVEKQMPQDERILKSNDIIRSNMPRPEDLEPVIKRLHLKYLDIIAGKSQKEIFSGEC